MLNAILTTYQGAFLGPIAKVLGLILEGIYSVLSSIGIENTGICLILFTFIVNALMIPLQIKQQKFAKMSAIMNPEIQEIQKKYKLSLNYLETTLFNTSMSLSTFSRNPRFLRKRNYETLT